jgi:hypothetical protein
MLGIRFLEPHMTDIYTFPWAPNPEYSTFYASGNEIWKYFKRTTEEYHLEENVRFDTKVLDLLGRKYQEEEN